MLMLFFSEKREFFTLIACVSGANNATGCPPEIPCGAYIGDQTAGFVDAEFVPPPTMLEDFTPETYELLGDQIVSAEVLDEIAMRGAISIDGDMTGIIDEEWTTTDTSHFKEISGETIGFYGESLNEQIIDTFIQETDNFLKLAVDFSRDKSLQLYSI